VQSSIAPTIAARGDLIWVAADGNLIRVDTRANTTTSVPLPAVRDNANLEAGLPAKERGVHFIRALAVDAHGHVAVALSASTQILVFDDAKKSFSKIDLPANDDAWSIAYYADGRLAVGAADAHGDVATMFVVDTDGKIGKPFTVPDASRLVTLAPGSDLLAGTLGPAIVHEDGRTQAVRLPAGVHANMSQGGVTPLPKGRFAVSTSSNVLVVDPDGSTSIVYRYPPGPCPLRGGPGLDPPSTTAPTNQECFVTPFAMQADRTGHLWIVRRRTAGTGPPIVVERL
jgi:hypothetical protein